MLKKEIKFKDWDGVDRTEVCYFNLNKAEVAEMELRTVGGLAAHVRLALDSTKTNPDILVDLFKNMIKKSYGVRSEDGKYFRKSDEIYDNFASTNAYSALFMELISDASAASDWFNGVAADALGGKKIEELAAKSEVPLRDGEIRFKAKAADYTPAELREMSDAEWNAVSLKFKGQMPKYMIAEGMRRMGVAAPDATQVVAVPEITAAPRRVLTPTELRSLSDEEFNEYQSWYSATHK